MSENSSRSGCRAVFLDRDGTINVEKEYLHRIDDFEFVPGAPEAIARLNRAGFKVIVVTNQSGVARGFFDISQVEALHTHMDKLLGRYGAQVDGYYICPHHPDAGLGSFKKKCFCRKPAPGMLLQAAAEHEIGLEGSYMVGDKEADLAAGRGAGCIPLLVETGYGSDTLRRCDHHSQISFVDLPDAIDFILKKSSEQGAEKLTE